MLNGPIRCGSVVVVARHYDTPGDFNPVGQGYFGKRLELLTVYGHPPPGDRWDMRASYAHTLDLLSSGKLVRQAGDTIDGQ
jgi:hypothetical protein